MADRYPRSREELEAENAQLRADVDRLRSSVGSLQAQLAARDGELARASRPRREPRVLDKAARDSFSRPAYSR